MKTQSSNPLKLAEDCINNNIMDLKIITIFILSFFCIGLFIIFLVQDSKIENLKHKIRMINVNNEIEVKTLRQVVSSWKRKFNGKHANYCKMKKKYDLVKKENEEKPKIIDR